MQNYSKMIGTISVVRALKCSLDDYNIQIMYLFLIEENL